MSAAGAASFNGVVTANAGVVVDNFTLDGTTLALSSGDMVLDSAGDIILDADGADTIFKDGGTTFGRIVKNGDNFEIKSEISNAYFKIYGNDGGSAITALNFDMSDAGAATFNGTLTTAAKGIATASLPAGTVLQVINAVNATEVTSNSDSYADTGLTASITPTSSSSKILVISSNDCTKLSADTTTAIRCYRGSTEIGGTIIGRKINDTDDTGKSQSVFSFTILDSPSSGSEVVYKTQFANSAASGTVRINAGSGSSTMCLMEIAA